VCCARVHAQLDQRYTIEQAMAHQWLDDVRLYMDIRQLEQNVSGVRRAFARVLQCGVRYMTTPADDNKFAERANALAAAEQVCERAESARTCSL
jgi:hypothetical protein